MSPFTDSEACTKSAKVPESAEKSAALTFAASSEAVKVKAGPLSHAEILAGCDPGVRPIVEALLERGFDATDSGDGAKTDMECALDFPHVAGMAPTFAFVADLEQHAADISDVASARSGAPWVCEVSRGTFDGKWTWFACPLEYRR